MNLFYLSTPLAVCYANDNDAYIPEIWAREALIQLEENMVVAPMVHRDFEDEIANFGDVVNTRRPEDFKIRRKTDSDTLEHQDARSTNVQVPLDQWFYTAFTIKDGEASKSFQDLVTTYLTPSIRNMARGVDRALLGRMAHGFLANRAGRLGAIDSTNSSDYVLDARETLNINKALDMDRKLIVSPTSETAMLKNELFVAADKRGDGGSALENARLGHLYGFDTFMAQNVNNITGSVDTATGTVTNALAAGGSGSQAVTLVGHEVVAGEFVTVAGNDQPTYATAATTGAGDTTAITLSEANKFATGAGAALTVYTACAVDLAAGYAVGYSKGINLDSFTNRPQVGQLIAFGSGANRRTYTIIESEANGADQMVWLDRPLEVALVDDQAAFPGPTGSFNVAFHRNSLALVTRPLQTPMAGSGARSAVINVGTLSMRVTMQYDIDAGGTKVNMDMLAGIQVLDTNLGVVMLG